MGPRTKSTSTLAATLHTTDLKTFLQQLQQTEEEMSGSHTQAWPVRFSSKVCEKRKHQSRAGTPLDPRTQARVSAAIKFTVSYSRPYVELSNTASSTVNPNHLIQIYVNVSPPPLFFFIAVFFTSLWEANCQVQMDFPKDESYSKKKTFPTFFSFLFFMQLEDKKKTVRKRTAHTQKQKTVWMREQEREIRVWMSTRMNVHSEYDCFCWLANTQVNYNPWMRVIYICEITFFPSRVSYRLHHYFPSPPYALSKDITPWLERCL